jgi:hypothetical protein
MENDTVRALARAAGLPLDDERVPLVAAQLDAWLSAANELSRKLGADELRAVMPVTSFRHPAAEGREE